jgi:hypothetical protein
MDARHKAGHDEFPAREVPKPFIFMTNAIGVPIALRRFASAAAGVGIGCALPKPH